MSKKLIAMIALAAILFTSVGVLYDHGVLASNFPAANSVADDENIQLGDCNADGIVNAKDVIMLKLYLSGKAQINMIAADVNQDGVIDNADVLATATTVFTGETVTVQNYPSVKEVADGTLLYCEDFESRDLSNHNNDTVTQLNWDMQNTDKGAFTDGTSLYSIVPYNSGKALFINNNNPGGTDTYVKLLTDAQMGYFHERNYTLQYDVQYMDALNATRYISVLLGYSGDRYMSFHLRNGGFGGNTVRIGSSFLNLDNGGVYAADNTASNTIADKLIGGGYDGTTHIFKNVALSIRYVVDWDNGCSIYARTIDKSTSSGGEWVLVSQFNADSAGASYFKPENFEAAVVLKTGSIINGYVDNIMLWTGTGDEPADKSAPLLQSGNDECYNHAYTAPTCENVRFCRHCDFTTGKKLSHNMSNGTCTLCGKTSQQIADAKNITNMSPANGANIQIANDNLKNFYTNFNATSSTVTYSPVGTTGNDSFYYPNYLTFSWNTEKPADYYRLNISLNSDMSNSEEYIVMSPSYTHKSLLLGKRYYWRVDAVYATETLRSTVNTFTTAEGIRTLYVEGVSNTRDIGGWMTSSGKRVKQGLVYRGGQLDPLSVNDGQTGITQSGINFMRNDLGIVMDLDLRGGSQTSTLLGSDVKVISFPESTPYYGYNDANAITNANKQKIFKTEIEAFADPDNYPMYVHCSLGRDRTGTLLFMINGLLGVSEADLLKDYWLSVHSLAGYHETAKLYQLQSNVNSLFSYMNTFSGSTLQKKIENYLLSIGVSSATMQAIRDILLEDASVASASTYYSSAQAPTYNASVSANVGKDEIPYSSANDGTNHYGYEIFDMMTSAEAAAAGVPSGYSGYVLKLARSAQNKDGVTVLLDPSSKNISKNNLSKIVFRVWIPTNTKEVRLYDGDWLMRYVPALTGQWVDITLGANGMNFVDGRSVDDLYDSNGNLKPISLSFRSTDNGAIAAYVDSVTYVAKTASEELPFADLGAGSQPYGRDSYELLTAEQAAAAGVPAGYSGHVLKLTGSSQGGMSTTLDPSSLKIHKTAFVKVTFRVWIPENVRGIRLYDGSWIMLYEPSSTEKGQWIDVTIDANGTNLASNKTIDDLFDANGMFRTVDFSFRFDGSASTTAYIDSVTFVTDSDDTVAPVITYTGATYLQTTAGSVFKLSNASAFDAEENRNVDIEYIWSDGALDENAALNVGTHTCILYAVDTTGNASTVTLTVVVGNKDVSAPKLYGVPDVVYASTGCRAFLGFKATDNFDKVQAVVHWPSGSFDRTGRLVAGEHTVRVEATDSTGNSTVKVVKVIVSASASITGTLVQD